MVLIAAILMLGCSQSYKTNLLPLKSLNSYGTGVAIGKTVVWVQACDDRQSATAAFGFNNIADATKAREVAFLYKPAFVSSLLALPSCRSISIEPIHPKGAI
jgi:hypothetical protein